MDFQRLRNDEIQLEKLLRSFEFVKLKEIHPIIFDSIDSTQEFAQKKYMGDKEGNLVIGRVQTNGRGREGRSWISQRGGLWITLTLKPPSSVLGEIPLLMIESIAKTLHEFGLNDCSPKPPNDVYFAGKKIAGVLSDARVQGDDSIDYVGIGINVNNNPAESEAISDIATSLANEIGKEVDLTRFTAALLANIDAAYSNAIKRTIPD
ncbi:MAG: biotin--[acetyl-CoA-carboxylase] ligase [Thaumarchaeota archaeon]|nr:biotin--[acetyl-CoA-carboxylase] ligase [Nitrososphaerota archaeon]